MIDLKIQYITEQGVIRNTVTYTSPELFVKELGQLTNLNEIPDTFKVFFVESEILCIISPDDLVVEVDANVFKKYKVLEESLPLAVRQKEDVLLTLSLDKERILQYCNKLNKKYFELSGVVGMKRNEIYYDGESKDLSPTSIMYLTKQFDNLYSICIETKISEVFFPFADLKSVDVFLCSSYTDPEHSYIFLHETKYKELYDNLIKV